MNINLAAKPATLKYIEYELFDDIDKAYENFIQWVMAFSKNKRIKSTSQDWLDAEIMEKINEMDTLLKKFKKSHFYFDKDNYKETRNEVQKLIRTKEKPESKITENIGKPKELWRSLKSLGLNFERSISNISCLKNEKSVNFDVKDIAKDLSAYFSNLAENVVSKLRNPSNKYCLFSVAGLT